MHLSVKVPYLTFKVRQSRRFKLIISLIMRQPKKRGQRRTASVSCLNRLVLAMASILLMLALADSLAIDWLVRFVRQYPSRFVAFYAPKARTLLQLAEYLSDQVPEELAQAWDFAVALVVLASIFHLIERLRVTLVSKLCETHKREGRASAPESQTSIVST